MKCDILSGLFFCVQIFGLTLESAEKRESTARAAKMNMEVEVVRVKITLACTDCKQRNYNLTKDKRVHTERMETKKYCPFCRKHTLHKETK